MADSALTKLAKAISAGSPKIRAYAIADALHEGVQDAQIKKLIEEVEVLKGSGSGPPRPGPEDPPVTPPIPPGPPIDPPSPLNLGTSLPARIGVSGGATTNVSTQAALSSALSTVANGSIINITANINGGGSLLTVSRNAAAGAPITITSNPGVLITNFSQWNVRGSYLRFLNLNIGYGTIDNLKFDTNSHDNEADGCTLHHATKMGFNVQASAANLQCWNCVIYTNGSTSNLNLDHGIYWGYASGQNVVANCLFYNNCTYNVQIYPNSSGVIVTGCTLDGGQVHDPYSRGGLVMGSEGGLTNNCKIVGSIFTNAPQNGITPYKAQTNNNSYDCIGYGNGGSDFASGSGMTYTNCSHGDPLYANRGSLDYRLNPGSPAISKVQAARYAYLPPTYRNGTTRLTADAGSEPKV